MNRMEHFFCSTSLWQRMTHRHLLPWVLSGARLGEHVLEIGAGYGAATGQLLKVAPRVTSLEVVNRSESASGSPSRTTGGCSRRHRLAGARASWSATRRWGHRHTPSSHC